MVGPGGLLVFAAQHGRRIGNPSSGFVWTTGDRDALGRRALTNAALITFSVTLVVWGGATFIAMVAGARNCFVID